MIGGKAIDPQKDCYEETDSEGNVSVYCEGESGVVLAGAAILAVAVSGIAMIADFVSKSPKEVVPGDFPEVGVARLSEPFRSLADRDRIDLQLTPQKTAGRCRLTLAASPQVNWLKTVQFMAGGKDDEIDLVRSTQGTRRVEWVEFPDAFLNMDFSQIILGKGKMFGVLSQMYVIRDPRPFAGSDIKFVWERD